MSKGLMTSAFLPLLILLLEHLFILLTHVLVLRLGGRSSKASSWSIRMHIKSSKKVNRKKRCFESIFESYFGERAKQFSSWQLGFWRCFQRANLIVGLALPSSPNSYFDLTVFWSAAFLSPNIKRFAFSQFTWGGGGRQLTRLSYWVCQTRMPLFIFSQWYAQRISWCLRSMLQCADLNPQKNFISSCYYLKFAGYKNITIMLLMEHSV